MVGRRFFRFPFGAIWAYFQGLCLLVLGRVSPGFGMLKYTVCFLGFRVHSCWEMIQIATEKRPTNTCCRVSRVLLLVDPSTTINTNVGRMIFFPSAAANKSLKKKTSCLNFFIPTSKREQFELWTLRDGVFFPLSATHSADEDPGEESQNCLQYKIQLP